MQKLHFYENEKDKKRNPSVLKPHVVYHESFGFATDKTTELLFIQHRLMNEFLSKKNLVDQFNDFQNKAFTTDSECKLWMKKWSVDHKSMIKYINRP